MKGAIFPCLKVYKKCLGRSKPTSTGGAPGSMRVPKILDFQCILFCIILTVFLLSSFYIYS